jgi:outer membrane receptor protein involved in Fe transport
LWRCAPKKGRTASGWWPAALVSLALGTAPPAAAQAGRPIDIAPGTLGEAIAALARQAQVSIGLAGALPALRVPALHGRMTVGQALSRLLEGSGLTAVQLDDKAFRLVRAAPVRAASGGPPLETIVVTAAKRRQTLMDIPFGLDVRLRPDLQPIPGPTTAAVAAGTDGLTLTNLGPGRNRPFIRGVADSPFNGPTQSTVATFIDDARITYAAPDPDLRLIDVERVELLKGPQGALYGSGTLGGILRIVPRRPALDRFEGEAALTLSAVTHGGAGAGGHAVLNIPVAADRLGLRVVAYGERLPGWIDDAGRQQQDVNAVAVSGGRLAARWSAGDWTLDLSGLSQFINARDSQYATADQGRLARATALAEPHDNDFRAVSQAASGRLWSLDLNTTTAYVRHELTSRLDASDSAALFGLPPPARYAESRSFTLLSHESRLADRSGRVPWIAGLSYLSAAADTTGSVTSVPGGATAPAGSLHQETADLALFGEATVRLGSALALGLGGRLFRAATHAEAAGAGPEPRFRAIREGLAPSVSLSWQPTPQLMAYARYAGAVRPGGLNGAATARPATFSADELDSVELGTRYAPADGLSLSAALFAFDWQHVQSDVLDLRGLVTTTNAGNARNVGAEAAADWRAGRWRAAAGLTLQHPRLRSRSALLPAGDERHLPAVPDIIGRLSLSREVILGGLDGTIAAQARYVGPAHLSFDPAIDRRMGNYAVVDLGVTVEKAGWSVQIALLNLLDTGANSFSFGNGFSMRTTRQTTPVQPRTMTLTVRRRF